MEDQNSSSPIHLETEHVPIEKVPPKRSFVKETVGDEMKTIRIDMDNEIEADAFSAILDAEGIPHMVVSHHSLAYNGLFQMTMGWGHMEIPEEYLERARELYQNYKKFLNE